jgi:primosomal protein N' (replication factor Y)
MAEGESETTRDAFPAAETSRWAEVFVDAPLRQGLTYACSPDHHAGQVVEVPLGRRKARGVITALLDQRPPGDFEIKPVLGPDEELPALGEARLRWLQWMSQYYLHPLGQVIANSFPPLRKKNARTTRKRAVVEEVTEAAPPPTLTEEQRKVIEGVRGHQGFGTHLIFGVTGSGKTEVYLRLLEDVLARGEQAVVLVPEISLTPQLVRRFAGRFGQNVAVYHSRLTDREKTNQWWEMVSENKKILIGARSALFCPLPKLGLVIIDEEHEPSFKQEEALRYHARDSAVVLGKFLNIPVVLGSATPSLESWQNALEGKYKLHVMSRRVEDRPMPRIQVVSLKTGPEVSRDRELPFWLSRELHGKIAERLEQKRQSALFLNRRGIAQTVLCPSCGATKDCPNCSVALTLHGRVHLVCHYCDYDEKLPEVCPECRMGELKSMGVGTELLELDLRGLFPEARIERVDRDRVSSREDLEDLITRMEEGSIDILVGTQMIAKGLDFERLTLVGMVLADIGFNLPDFRACERSFQLLMQMGGRAGRHRDAGEVIIQAFNSEHPSVTFSLGHDYRGFAEAELRLRKELLYPPFGRLACVKLQGLHLPKVHRAAEELGELARSLVGGEAGVEILGPSESPLAKIRNQFRYQLLVKAPRFQSLNRICRRLEDRAAKRNAFEGVKISFDIDPINML